MHIKKCSKCNFEKSLSEFSRCSAKKDGLQNYCKCCAAQKTKTWQNYNQDDYRQLVKKWKENNKERVRDINNNYRKLYYEKHPENVKLSKKKWRDKNKHLISIYSACRRKQIDRQSVKLSKDMLIEIKSIYDQSKILSEQTGIPHHVDHIIPLKAKMCSGLHVPWNLQIITASENVRKGNRMPTNL